MNILVIHETEYIQKMIFEYQIIPEILASRGHRVFVIDYPTNWSKDNQKPIFSLQPEVIRNVSRTKKAGTITLIRPAFIRLPIISRLTASLSYFPLIDAVINQYKIDVVVLLAVPTNGIQTLLAAGRNGVPVYFRLLDVLHQLVPHGLLRWPAYLFEKIIYRRVDRLSAITPRLRDYAIKMGANPATSSYLPSGSDADLFYHQEKDPALLAKYCLNADDIVLLFAGTLYNFSGLDKIISALPQELVKEPRLKLLLVGAGEQERFLRAQVKSLGLEGRVVFTGFINYPELPCYINLADICINPFEINQTTNLIFPGKIYQYLACKKPVIASKLQGMLDIFSVNDIESGVFYYDTVDEFFGLVPEIIRHRVIDPNPSLQEITTTLERELAELSSNKRGGLS